MHPDARILLGVVPSVFILVHTACSGTVVSGGGTGGTGGTGAGVSTTITTVPGSGAYGNYNSGPIQFGGGGTDAGTTILPTSIAIVASKIHYDGGGGVGGAPLCWGADGPGCTQGVDPDTLYLIVGDPAPTCAVPEPHVPCDGHYGAYIGIPPALQTPGTLSLSQTPGVLSDTFATGADDPSVSFGCVQGGAGLLGTLTIASIDSAKVEFTLSGTNPIQLFAKGTVDIDGSYSAQRCP